MIYRVTVSPTARDALVAITDKRIQRNIVNRLSRLEKDPEKQGEPLSVNLEGYRSIRAVSERYRIIYQIIEAEVYEGTEDSKAEDKEPIVSVEFIGIRREGSKSDVYVLFSKLVERL